jgi:hypothetical protein
MRRDGGQHLARARRASTVGAATNTPSTRYCKNRAPTASIDRGVDWSFDFWIGPEAPSPEKAIGPSDRSDQGQCVDQRMPEGRGERQPLINSH